ncbi:putative alpha-galactosidase [Aspergillus alliaceus]|uniref:putative alpha-galactosidase n=1 Tax=Petromyces alliaceus TaxID=209559 RepID=UPI0012A76AAE|nr:putative alpha-galactosidase A [Aspergillus alliaceus]KAB8238718.1 putative alpha-galactosidase A [Aspergillus alliaceus]
MYIQRMTRTMKLIAKGISLATALAGTMPAQVVASIENPNLLPTPPMGFNNWARFMCDLNETLFVETADAMASNGLLEAGYNRINLDDCWMNYQRAENGSLEWNITKFPRGLPWLGEYVKSKGFNFGIYEDSGNLTCGGYPGSLGYEEIDAETFAAWGIDYLKLDGCNVYPTEGRTLQEEYEYLYGHWHEILRKMDNPLIFSESAPAYFSITDNYTDWYTVMGWVPEYGELARHSVDVLVYSGEGSAWDSIMTNYRYNTLVARYQRPGYYNDPDFLIPDHPGLSIDERRSQFALWASFSAPLIISAYVPDLPSEDIDFLTNRALIEVDQDPKAEQATLASRDSNLDVLTRSLADGSRLLTVLNHGNQPSQTDIPLDVLGLSPDCTFKAEDLWDGSTHTIKGHIRVKLNTHATGVYKIPLSHECSTVIPTGIIFNTASGKCLTGSKSIAQFETCNGKRSQIWQVESSGVLRPLSEQTKCLTGSGKAVSLEACKERSSQKWSYATTGNLKNGESGTCLTEGEGLGVCGFEVNNQVFGLPSGVNLS